MATERLARIPASMKGFVERGTIAGSVTLVARHGKVAAIDAVGSQDIEAKKPMSPDTIFRIASMTKPFTGVGIMMLVEDGRLSLWDPVEKYLPEFRDMWLVESREGDARLILKRPARAMRIHDLMTHTSGLTDGPAHAGDPSLVVTPTLPHGVFYGMVWYGGFPNFQPRTLAEAVLAISRQPLEFDPGTKWTYSSTGITILGRIIEVVSGQPYEQFLEQRIFGPLGMTDTSFFPGAAKTGRLAAAYALENGKLVRASETERQRQAPAYPNPAGGLYSTAMDLAAFYQMMLNGGTYKGVRILSKASVSAMTSVQTGDLEVSGPTHGSAYGLTWELIRGPLDGLALNSPGTFGHAGSLGTQGWVDPAKDLIGVFLIQRTRNNGPDEATAFRALACAAVSD
jgi:CubicO group peptidase (beta-lactamase class C family)